MNFVYYSEKRGDLMGLNERFLKNVALYCNLEGKKVLEIGCGNGDDLKYINENYKPASIIGIDKYLDSWWSTESSKGNNWAVQDGDVMEMDFEDNTFDVVYSLATFEHISDVGKALSEIKRVLKPYGQFYTEFSPIWTSVIGHHYDFWISEEKAKLIPPWGHLYMSENEMYEYISEKVDENEAKKACYQIYHSDIINRTSKKEFYEIFQKSGLWIKSLNEQIGFNRSAYYGNRDSELSEEILDKIPNDLNKHDLATMGFALYMEKFTSI